MPYAIRLARPDDPHWEAPNPMYADAPRAAEGPATVGGGYNRGTLSGVVDANLRQAINDYSEMIAQAGELVFAKDDKIRILPSEFTPNLDHPAFDAVGTPLWTTAEKFDAYGDSVAQGYVRLDYLSTGPPPHSTALAR